MTQNQWTAVDQYLTDAFIPSDAALEGALKASTLAGLPEIQVTSNQGKLLSILAQSIGARSILEIGTLGGYSTIWLARALPADGTLITLEYEPRHAEVARKNLANAGLTGKVEVRLGKALDLLPALVDHAPFDFVFIDADKVNTAAYFEWALKLTRLGSMIIVDNVVRGGGVVDANSTDSNVQGIRQFIEMASKEPRVTVSAIQTVGSKSYDGFAVALVIEAA